MNNRGDFQSLMIMIIVVFALAVASIIFVKVLLDITGELKDTGQFSNRSVQTMEVVEDRAIPLLDFFVFFTLVSFMIGLIISSIYMDVHPAITIIFIIALIIAVFFGGQLVNVYSEITTTPQLASTSSQFTKTNLVLGEYFPIIILVVGVIVIIILYGKSRRVGEV